MEMKHAETLKKPRLGQVGNYWLSKNSDRAGAEDSWCRTWYDKRTRQTRRASRPWLEMEADSEVYYISFRGRRVTSNNLKYVIGMAAGRRY